jgi:hypothetical protein
MTSIPWCWTSIRLHSFKRITVTAQRFLSTVRSVPLNWADRPNSDLERFVRDEVTRPIATGVLRCSILCGVIDHVNHQLG